jgi:hypothetical protein
MRSQDVPTLLKKQQESQQYYFQNKDNILHPAKDNGAAYTEYQSRHQDMLGLINESKEAAKAMSEIGKAKLNPQTSYMFEDPTFMDQLKLHELPIGDPNRRGINLATLLVPDKPKTTKDWEDLNKYATGGIPYDKVPGESKSIGNFKISTPIYSQYSPENQKLIGQHYANAYDTERGWRSEAVKTFNEIQSDPIQFQRYNDTFKSLYGKNIDNPKDAWIAKGILDNNRKATEFKESEDVFGRQKAMEKLRVGDELWLAQQKAKIPPKDVEMNNAWLEGYWRNRIVPAKLGEPTPFHDPNNPVQMKLGYELKPDKVMLDALSRDGRQPEAVYVTDKNEIQPIFYEYEETHDEKGKKTGVRVKTDENGQPVPDKDLSKPMDLEQALISTGYKTLSKGKKFAATMSNIVGEGAKEQKKTESKQKVDIENLRKKYNY